MKNILNVLKSKSYFIPVAIIVAGILIAGAFYYTNQCGSSISMKEAGEKSITFINQTLESQGVAASLVDVIDEGEVFRIHLKIEETEYDSYLTKSGKFLFPSGYNLDEVMIEQEEEPVSFEPGVLDSFAQCLSEAGMKFYGSDYCGWCAKQKELFGDSFQYVVYIDCVDHETEQWSEECMAAKIEATPTWQLPDGEMSTGYKTLEQLSELAGCSIQ